MPKLETVTEHASSHGSHRSPSFGWGTPRSDNVLGWGTPRSENDFMDVDNEREPPSTHDEEPSPFPPDSDVDGDGDAADNNDRQVTIASTAADRPATPPPDQAAASPPFPDYMDDEENYDDTRIAF